MSGDAVMGGQSFLRPDTTYFLQQSDIRKSNISEPASASLHEKIAQVTFNIDPSISKMPDEHIKLCEYLKDRYLTIDIFDAEN